MMEAFSRSSFAKATKDKPLGTRSWSEARQQLGSRLLLIAASLFYLSPMYWMVVTAFKSDQELAEFPADALAARTGLAELRSGNQDVPFSPLSREHDLLCSVHRIRQRPL